MKRLLLLAALVLGLQGCALTDAELDVSHDPAKVNQGPISDSEPRVIMVAGLADAREDQARIGYKKNGFGQNTADITTQKPVTEIIQQALDHAIVSNGHTIGPGGIVVSGKVNQFWMDVDVNFTHIEIICNIETDLLFKDSTLDAVFYTNTYRGSYREKKQVGTESNYQAVIEGAVNALLDDVVFDEDLAEALRGH